MINTRPCVSINYWQPTIPTWFLPFLQTKYFDSGDYNMARAQMATANKQKQVPEVKQVTGDHMPTPDEMPRIRKQSQSTLVTGPIYPSWRFSAFFGFFISFFPCFFIWSKCDLLRCLCIINCNLVMARTTDNTYSNFFLKTCV